MKKKFISVLTYLSLLLLSSCHDAPLPVPPDTTDYTGPYGIVSGKIATPAGNALSGVTISIVSSFTNLTTVLSDTSGRFTHTKVPAGNVTIKGTKGNFFTTMNLTVPKDDTIFIPNITLYPNNKMAYVRGSNDRIQDMVRELGYPMDSLEVYDIGDSYMFNIGEYSMLFLNCGVLDSDSIKNNLMKFIRNGGKVYTTDWAGIYLKKLFPEEIDFDQSGDPQQISGDVTDTILVRNLGKSNITVVYDDGSWSTITDVDSTTFGEMLRGTYVTDFGVKYDRPIAVYRREGSGAILFTTFHMHSNRTPDMLNFLKEIIFF